jgi:Fe-S-cluster containining protein
MLNPCSLCKAECCKSYLITATAFDILRIARRTGRKPKDFALLEQARILSYDPDTTLDMEDDSWIHLLCLKSHPCSFLEHDRCTIHGFAPMACRRFPHMLDGKRNCRFCPLPSQLMFRLRAPDVSADAFLAENTAYKRIVKEWNAKPGKTADCLAFLVRRAEELTSSGTVQG